MADESKIELLENDDGQNSQTEPETNEDDEALPEDAEDDPTDDVTSNGSYTDETAPTLAYRSVGREHSIPWTFNLRRIHNIEVCIEHLKQEVDTISAIIHHTLGDAHEPACTSWSSNFKRPLPTKVTFCLEYTRTPKTITYSGSVLLPDDGEPLDGPITIALDSSRKHMIITPGSNETIATKLGNGHSASITLACQALMKAGYELNLAGLPFEEA